MSKPLFLNSDNAIRDLQDTARHITHSCPGVTFSVVLSNGTQQPGRPLPKPKLQTENAKLSVAQAPKRTNMPQLPVN